ncbi:MAG: lipid II flippase MurJ, partial [Paracoccaceae bacterium]
VNAGLALGLAPVIGYLAAAFGTTAAAWAMVYLLWRGRGGMGHAAGFDPDFVIKARRILMAALAMGFCLLALNWLLHDALAMARWRYLALAGMVAGGAVSYFGIGQAIGAVSLSELRQLLRR